MKHTHLSQFIEEHALLNGVGQILLAAPEILAQRHLHLGQLVHLLPDFVFVRLANNGEQFFARRQTFVNVGLFFLKKLYFWINKHCDLCKNNILVEKQQ